MDGTIKPTNLVICPIRDDTGRTCFIQSVGDQVVINSEGCPVTLSRAGAGEVADILRRFANRGDLGGAAVIRKFGDLHYFVDHHRFYWKGRHLEMLTASEVRLILALVEAAPGDITHRALYDAVRGPGFIAGDGAEGYRTNVRTFIKRIRQKLVAIDPNFRAIQTYNGFGYRWCGPL